eukprot:COSAG04_NODE_437_length_14435_cov_4.075126_2_plen_261_part_00
MDVAAEYRQEVEDLERNEVWRDLFRTGCGTKAEKKESPGRLSKPSAAVIWTSWTVCWIVTMLASTQAVDTVEEIMAVKTFWLAGAVLVVNDVVFKAVNGRGTSWDKIRLPSVKAVEKQQGGEGREDESTAPPTSAAGGWPEPQVSMHLTVGGAIGQLGRPGLAAAERRERAIPRLYSAPQRYCAPTGVGWGGREGGLGGRWRRSAAAGARRRTLLGSIYVRGYVKPGAAAPGRHLGSAKAVGSGAARGSRAWVDRAYICT